MNHPTQEELIEFHCGESAPARAGEIERHVESCAECRAQVESWRGVQRRLGAWRLPARAAVARRSRAGSPIRWAAAAMVLLLVGFAVARWTAPRPDVAALRAAMAKELREELRAELRQFSDVQLKRQEQYQKALTRTLGELEARRLADYAGLRRDVETVAVRAEDEFSNTREGIARLTALTPAGPAVTK